MHGRTVSPMVSFLQLEAKSELLRILDLGALLRKTRYRVPAGTPIYSMIPSVYRLCTLFLSTKSYLLSVYQCELTNTDISQYGSSLRRNPERCSRRSRRYPRLRRTFKHMSRTGSTPLKLLLDTERPRCSPATPLLRGCRIQFVVIVVIE